MSSDSLPLPNQRADMNVVPMIDILLVLIIIFMLQRLAVIDVLLSAPAEVGQGAPMHEIVLSIDAAGDYAINRLPVATDSLDAVLRSVFKDRPRKTLLIHPDRHLAFRDVARAMDAARGAGVQTLSLVPDHP